MAIPGFQDFMNPVLEVYAHSKTDLQVQDIVNTVADRLKLTPDERLELLNSGRETVMHNRTSWATYYLYRAGMLDRTRRGYYAITQAGRDALASKKKINTNFLTQCAEFAEFLASSNPELKKKSISDSVDLAAENVCIESQGPEERIEIAIEELNVKLRDDILFHLKKVSPQQFEQIVVDLMVAMGYGVGNPTQYVCDGGIDGIINEDELGLSKIYLQAKRYTDAKVNEKEMRNFVGALATNNVVKGVFITTSCFADKAKKAAANARGHVVRLIDGTELAELMRVHNLGARPKKNYDIKELDNAYFE